VLSVGCGTGYYEFAVKRFTDSLFCLDSSREMLTICRMRGFKNVICGSALCLPIRSGAFDCVYALSISSIGGASANYYSRVRNCPLNETCGKEGRQNCNRRPQTLWKKIDVLLRHGNPNADRFRVSPEEVKGSYNRSSLKAVKLLVLPPLPYAILRRIEYPKADRMISRLLLNRLGLYLFVTGIK